MPGLNWKPNAQEVLDRRRRFFRRQMLDGILVTFFCIDVDAGEEWAAFDRKWGTRASGEARPFPSNGEIFDRETVGMRKRAAVLDRNGGRMSFRSSSIRPS